MAGPLPHVALVAVATGASVVLAVYAARHRDEPGATTFAALMGFIALWVATYGVSLFTADPWRRLVMERAQWFGASFTPVALLLFVLTYTGHDDVVSRRTTAALATPPAVATVLVWLNPADVMYSEWGVVVQDGIVLINMTWQGGFYAHVLYLYALVAVAAALMVRLVFVSEYLYADQSALLLVGIAAPVVGSVWDLFGPNGIVVGELAPYGFTVTGLAFGYALFRRRLFDMVPATRQLGQHAAIGQLEDGILIVDTARRIVYCNAAAGDILDCDPADAIDRAVRDLVDEDAIDFETEDALAELERDDRIYEVRTSPIEDRQGRLIGHTLLLTDVTARERRERRLAAQRDDLERLEELNGALRGVNQALVSASSRAEIERAVCERLAATGLYRTACVGDVATWTGDADRWLVAGDGGTERTAPAFASEVGETDLDGGEETALATGRHGDDEDGTWALVPVAYGRTVFGALGLETARETISERERAVLGELGEIVGHAINAVESRQLLSAESVVELTVECDGAEDPLVAATTPEGRLELTGVVANGDGGTVAYLRAADGDAATLRERLSAAGEGSVRTVGDEEDGDLLEWQVTGDALLGTLVEYGTNATGAMAADGTATVDLEIASGADVRALTDHLEERFADARVVAKRERTGPAAAATLAGANLDALTDRQREAIEAAYRAGYFDWPRESTAEDVADALDITAPTLHAHLRKAESTLLTELFEGQQPTD